MLPQRQHLAGQCSVCNSDWISRFASTAPSALGASAIIRIGLTCTSAVGPLLTRQSRLSQTRRFGVIHHHATSPPESSTDPRVCLEFPIDHAMYERHIIHDCEMSAFPDVDLQ